MDRDHLAAALPDDVPLAAVRRGPMTESVHRGRFAVRDPFGVPLDAAGDPGGYVYLRSSAKPLQALPLVLSGAADALDLTDEELAVACASHNGEEAHLYAVRSLLGKAGLSEDDLQSGPHPPLYAPAADELATSGGKPVAVHSNCSGKHAGMLAVCAHEGWELESYRSPEHPLQRRILEVIARCCGVEADEALLAGDNCGVPTFAVPLGALATAFARLATGEELPEDLAAAAQRTRDAMRARPFLVAGTGRFDTAVMRGTPLVAKSGAEGVFACGSPQGWGLALKVSDGAGRATRPAALAALSGRGVEVAGEPAATETFDLHGEAVGRVEPLL